MIIGQSTLPVGIGIGAGVIAVSALTGFLESCLFEIVPGDTNTFAVVSIFLALVAMAANFIPAYRGTRIDPIAALRYE